MATRGKSQELARKRIIKKRGYKCELCGYVGYLDLHHIKPLKDGGTHNDDNVILLCEYCHAKIHGYKKKKWLDIRRKYYLPGK